MPGGKRNRRFKKASANEEKRELVFKEEGQQYAVVLSMAGNNRVKAHCMDGKQRMCKIRGSMQKKVWIRVDDLILISLREFQDSKADVIFKYSEEEARALMKKGEIPDPTKIKQCFEEKEEEDCAFEFDDI